MEWRMALEHLYLLPVCWQLFQYDPGAKSRACTWAEFFERKIGITNKTLFSPWLSGSCHGNVQKCEWVCCTSSGMALNRKTAYTHVTVACIISSSRNVDRLELTTETYRQILVLTETQKVFPSSLSTVSQQSLCVTHRANKQFSCKFWEEWDRFYCVRQNSCVSKPLDSI